MTQRMNAWISWILKRCSLLTTSSWKFVVAATLTIEDKCGMSFSNAYCRSYSTRSSSTIELPSCHSVSPVSVDRFLASFEENTAFFLFKRKKSIQTKNLNRDTDQATLCSSIHFCPITAFLSFSSVVA
jgi:hypothetical protein